MDDESLQEWSARRHALGYLAILSIRQGSAIDLHSWYPVGMDDIKVVKLDGHGEWRYRAEARTSTGFQKSGPCARTRIQALEQLTGQLAIMVPLDGADAAIRPPQSQRMDLGMGGEPLKCVHTSSLPRRLGSPFTTQFSPGSGLTRPEIPPTVDHCTPQIFEEPSPSTYIVLLHGRLQSALGNLQTNGYEGKD